MAIFNCNLQNFNRSGGMRNICAAASYRSGEKIRSVDDGMVKYPHRNSSDIQFQTILNNPYKNRQELWNAVEKSEIRKNSNLGREVEIALPKELSNEQRKNLVCEISQHLVKRYGVAVDVSIHREKNGNGNYHAHILMTTRRIQKGKLGEKTRELDQKTTGAKEFHHIRNEIYAAITNRYLEKAGINQKISGEKTKHELKPVHHRHNAEKKAYNEYVKELQIVNNNIKRELKKNEREQFGIIKERIAEENRKEQSITGETRKVEERKRFFREKIKLIREGINKFRNKIREGINKFRNKIKLFAGKKIKNKTLSNDIQRVKKHKWERSEEYER